MIQPRRKIRPNARMQACACAARTGPLEEFFKFLPQIGLLMADRQWKMATSWLASAPWTKFRQAIHSTVSARHRLRIGEGHRAGARESLLTASDQETVPRETSRRTFSIQVSASVALCEPSDSFLIQNGRK